jgi:hypothetical protein
LKLPAPEPLHRGCKCLQPLEQEVALEREMAHFITQQLFCDGLDDGIAATQGEEAEIDLGDEFGGQEHLDVELEVHQVPHPAEDGVGPLLLKQVSAQMGNSAYEEGRVALLLRDEEVHGTLIALEAFERGNAAGVTAQTRAAAAFTELEDGERACKRDAFFIRQRARHVWKLKFAVEACVGLEVVDPMLGVHRRSWFLVLGSLVIRRLGAWSGEIRGRVWYAVRRRSGGGAA